MKHSLTTIAAVIAVVLLAPAAVAAGGTWKNLNYAVSGSWSITSGKEGHTLKLTGFKTQSAPDLKLFLSPLPGGSITGKNATKGAHFVAKLKKSNGDQTYLIPASVDLGKFQTLLLHCEKFSKPWGWGAL